MATQPEVEEVPERHHHKYENPNVSHALLHWKIEHPNLIVMGNHDEWKNDHEEWEDRSKHQLSYSFHLDEFFPLDFSCKVFNEATGAA